MFVVARVVSENRERHGRGARTERSSATKGGTSSSSRSAAASSRGRCGWDEPTASGRRSLAGLSAGERYAAEGSFVLKSELLKSEAGHEH